MEFNIIDIKVLKFIKNNKNVTNAGLEKKYGSKYRPVIDKLYKKGLIECPNVSYSDTIITAVGLPAMDNWKISDTGAYYLASFKEERKLTGKERLFNYFLGFGSGMLSGCMIQLFIRLINSR